MKLLKFFDYCYKSCFFCSKTGRFLSFPQTNIKCIFCACVSAILWINPFYSYSLKCLKRKSGWRWKVRQSRAGCNVTSSCRVNEVDSSKKNQAKWLLCRSSHQFVKELQGSFNLGIFKANARILREKAGRLDRWSKSCLSCGGDHGMDKESVRRQCGGNDVNS